MDYKEGKGMITQVLGFVGAHKLLFGVGLVGSLLAFHTGSILLAKHVAKKEQRAETTAVIQDLLVQQEKINAEIYYEVASADVDSVRSSLLDDARISNPSVSALVTGPDRLQSGSDSGYGRSSDSIGGGAQKIIRNTYQNLCEQTGCQICLSISYDFTYGVAAQCMD